MAETTILARRTWGADNRFALALEWKLADLWVGAFWRNSRRENRFDLWVCVVPFLPIHFTYDPGIFG
jgi:hypothetical protein